MRKLLLASLTGWSLFTTGCGGKIEQPFELVCLTFGRPDYPLGSLVRLSCEGGVWTEVGRAELARDAIFLHAPPYPAGVFPFVSIIEAGGEETSALWHWHLDSTAEPQYQLPLTGRVVMLVARHPKANRAAVCYYASSQVNLINAEYQRRAVTLGANARCSLAVINLDRPDSLIPVTACQFQVPAWLPGGEVAFIDRAENLMKYNPDSGSVTLLVPRVEFFAASGNGKLCAVDAHGRLSFYGPDGQGQGEPLDSASVPMLSPDGRYLAYQHNDHDLWIRDLESGHETEVGLGDPRNWSADSRLLLFQGRRAEEGRIQTFFRVADAATGVSIEVPQSGFMLDAVLFP